MRLVFSEVVPGAYPPSGGDCDVRALIPFSVAPYEHAVVRTGLALDVPEGHVVLICSKRGLAERRQVHVLNAPAIIHPGSSAEEIVVIIKNSSPVEFVAEEGTPIAQMILLKTVAIEPTSYPGDRPGAEKKGG